MAHKLKLPAYPDLPAANRSPSAMADASVPLAGLSGSDLVAIARRIVESQPKGVASALRFWMRDHNR